jgi:hypothetical protein
MQTAIENFRLNIERVRHLGGLYDAICGLTTSAIDASDLLRAQVMLAVSALDFYIHEATVRGMVEVYEGIRPPTDAFRRQKVSGSLLLGNALASSAAFESDIRERHSFLSFQQPDKISDAIRLFCDKPLWQVVAQQLGLNDSDVKSRLRLVVDRRNKIAHEADVDPSFPGVRWPISREDAIASLNFITEICETINSAVEL